MKKEVKASAKAGAPKAKAKPAAKVGAKAKAKRVEVSDMTERLMHVPLPAHVPPRDEEVGRDSAPSMRVTIELPRVMAEPMGGQLGHPSWGWAGCWRAMRSRGRCRKMRSRIACAGWWKSLCRCRLKQVLGLACAWGLRLSTRLCCGDRSSPLQL